MAQELPIYSFQVVWFSKCSYPVCTYDATMSTLRYNIQVLFKGIDNIKNMVQHTTLASAMPMCRELFGILPV